jgi:hypothetical protein
MAGEAAAGQDRGDVPYVDGLMAGEIDALVESFAGEPELYHPVRGRIKGRRAVEEHVDADPPLRPTM